MQFPITITAKILDISPQFYVRDANGELVLYVKQKLLAFREKVDIFSDQTMSAAVMRMRADRILDFNANYVIDDASGRNLGALRRAGVRSLWRASYQLHRNAAGTGLSPVGEISETNPWIKLIDGLVGEIPVVGWLTGWFLNPSYSLRTDNGQELLRIVKKPSLLERRFELALMAPLGEADQRLAVAASLMLVVLEGARG